MPDSKKTKDQLIEELKIAHMRITDLEGCESERKRVEQEIQKSEERYHRMLGSVTNYIYTVSVEDGAAVSTFHGPGCAGVTGYTSEDYSADPNLWYKMVHEDDHKAVLEQAQLALTGGDPSPLEHRIMHWDGSIRWISNTLVTRRDEAGRVIMYDGLIADITERKRAEEALRESEEAYHRQFTDNSATMLLIDPENGRIIDANTAALGFYGYSYEQMLVMCITDINTLPASDVKRHMELVKSGNCNRFEFQHRLADGSIRDVDVSVSLIRFGGRSLLSSIIYDITERKRVEEELVTSRRWLADLLSWKESIINNSAVGILVVAKDRIITEVNKGFLEMFGFSSEELIGQSASMIHITREMFKEFGERYWAATSTHKVVNVQWQLRRKNGEIFWCELTGCAINSQDIWQGVVWVIIDNSERKRLQETMVQTEKMMSLGGLAAGMAHEINNPLGIILQSAQVILMRLDPDVEANRKTALECGCDMACINRYLETRRALEFLEGIREAGARAAKIVADILEFSHKSEMGRTFVSINTVLDKSLELAGSDYDLKKKFDFRQIAITRDYQQDLPLVAGIEVQLEQVFMNVLRNAAQAISERQDQGSAAMIVMRTRLDGKDVQIEIEDNGPGMDEATRKRVFEPFFTTKAPGIGTGLGLSVSYFIITTNHSGNFAVESAPGRGARFIIALPVESVAGSEVPDVASRALKNSPA